MCVSYTTGPSKVPRTGFVTRTSALSAIIPVLLLRTTFTLRLACCLAVRTTATRSAGGVD